MSDDVVTATEGAEREPASPEVSAVGQEGQASQPAKAVDPDAEFWEQARKKDWSKAPEDIRAEVEKPFLSNYTRKYQELNQLHQQLSQQQQQFYGQLITKLQEKGVEPSIDEREQLLQRVQNGEFESIGPLIDKAVDSKIRPIVEDRAREWAIREAKGLHPWVADPQHEREIADVVNSNPVLREMANANNFRYAPQVLAGVALQLENQALKAQLQQAAALKTEYEKLKGMQDRAKGLPGTTSRAGTTPSASPVKEHDTMKDAMRAALIEMGRTPDF